MNNYLDYHKYLKKTSISGFIYRRLILYPIFRLILGKKYIDLGCGLGDLLGYSPNNSVGLDINPFNIQYAKDKGYKAKLIKDDGLLPLPDSSYASLICDNVIEHIEDPSQLILEIKRVLIPGGKVLIGVPQQKGYMRDPDHKVFYNEEKIRNLFCLKNNFILVSSFYLPIPVKFFGKYIKQQALYVYLESPHK